MFQQVSNSNFICSLDGCRWLRNYFFLFGLFDFIVGWKIIFIISSLFLFLFLRFTKLILKLKCEFIFKMKNSCTLWTSYWLVIERIDHNHRWLARLVLDYSKITLRFLVEYAFSLIERTLYVSESFHDWENWKRKRVESFFCCWGSQSNSYALSDLKDLLQATQ